MCRGCITKSILYRELASYSLLFVTFILCDARIVSHEEPVSRMLGIEWFNRARLLARLSAKVPISSIVRRYCSLERRPYPNAKAWRFPESSTYLIKDRTDRPITILPLFLWLTYLYEQNSDPNIWHSLFLLLRF